MSIATLRKTRAAGGKGGAGQAAEAPGAPEPRDLGRRRPRSITLTEIGLTIVCAISAVCLTWFVFYQVTGLSGVGGFVLASMLAFLGLYYFANRQLYGKMAAVDRVVASLVTFGSVGISAVLVLVVAFLFVRGHGVISLHFLTHSMQGVQETSAAGAGGVGHAIVGTAEVVGLAVLIGAPAGIATAIFLNEVGGTSSGRTKAISGLIRTIVTAMSAVPSIVAGLFIYVVFVTDLHWGFNGFAGSLALSILLLPNITRTTEEILKVVHGSLREASMALGAPEWRTVWSVVLPTARTGIVTAVLLGIARVIGETAPLLVTTSSNTAFNWNAFHNPIETLPIYIWDSYGSPHQADITRAFGCGVALVGLVLLLFVTARVVASIRPGSVKALTGKLKRNSLEVGA